MDESSIIWKIADAIGVLGLPMVGYFIKSHNNRFEALENRHSKRMDNVEVVALKAAEDINEFKLDAEKRFAKEETMQASLSRIHDRMDDIGSDIKQILTRVGQGQNHGNL